MTQNLVEPSLALDGVSKTYRTRQGQVVRALDNVSLKVEPGEFVAVQGPSGSGKTTLLLVAGTLLCPDAGRVLLAGAAPYDLNPDGRAKFRARAVGFVFQQFHLVPYLNVIDNVLSPALAVTIEGARARAQELIEHLGLQHRMRHVPEELSTGERQRVALARALLNRPRVILADEPTGNLDAASAEAVLGYLEEFVTTGGCVLLVTHDERSVRRASRVLQLRAGRFESAG